MSYFSKINILRDTFDLITQNHISDELSIMSQFYPNISYFLYFFLRFHPLLSCGNTWVWSKCVLRYTMHGGVGIVYIWVSFVCRGHHFVDKAFLSRQICLYHGSHCRMIDYICTPFNPQNAKLAYLKCLIFAHLKLCLAAATHNFKWVKIRQIC